MCTARHSTERNHWGVSTLSLHCRLLYPSVTLCHPPSCPNIWTLSSIVANASMASVQSRLPLLMQRWTVPLPPSFPDRWPRGGPPIRRFLRSVSGEFGGASETTPWMFLHEQCFWVGTHSGMLREWISFATGNYGMTSKSVHSWHPFWLAFCFPHAYNAGGWETRECSSMLQSLLAATVAQLYHPCDVDDHQACTARSSHCEGHTVWTPCSCIAENASPPGMLLCRRHGLQWDFLNLFGFFNPTVHCRYEGLLKPLGFSHEELPTQSVGPREVRGMQCTTGHRATAW